MSTNLILAACISLLSSPAFADDLDMSGRDSWFAFGTGSSGHNQAVAIGSARKNAYGTNLRLLSVKNDIARAEPLRQGKLDFAAAEIGGVYLAQEGELEFGAGRWRPQKVRVLLQNAGAKFGFARSYQTCCPTAQSRSQK